MDKEEYLCLYEAIESELRPVYQKYVTVAPHVLKDVLRDVGRRISRIEGTAEEKNG